MIQRKTVAASLIGLGLFASGVAIGQDPGMWARHPHLRDAEQMCHQADDHLLAAQRLNHWDMDGHAARAEGLLRQADQEIRAAAISADRAHRY
ncbi:MAG: hypothetical protein WA294_11545 [Acidobacteriaceae bacterium]